jgi:3-oxoacyl-(acyl-carrier-protein) synthase
MLLQLGKADIIVCGGSEAAVTASGMGGFNSLMAFLQEMMIIKQLLDLLTKTEMDLY